MKKPLIALTVTMMIAGCSTLKTDQAIPLLQAETAKMLGLGSSDEITVTNVNGAQPDALGGQKLSYRATTEKGRIFDCSSLMMPGILGSSPSLSAPKMVRPMTVAASSMVSSRWRRAQSSSASLPAERVTGL